MQRLKKSLFAFLISVMCLGSVKAVICSNQEKAEFNRLITNVKASYEIKERLEEVNDPDSEDGSFYDGGDDGDAVEKPIINYLNINITNLNEKFYLVISNDYDDEIRTYHYSDSNNGILTFAWENVDKVTIFTIKIYSSDKTNCQDELLKTLTLRTPRFNEYYSYAICENAQNLNLCQKYVTFAPMDFEEFVQKVNGYNEEANPNQNQVPNEEKTTWEKVKDFIIDNKYYFIGGGVVIVGVTAGVVVVVIRKKRRRIEL